MLGKGDKWMEERRRQKKLAKMEDFRKKRKALRKIYINSATDEDLLETVEVFKEKYYPGAFAGGGRRERGASELC